ncbi:YdgA family protein [Deinococcus hohokamensis]|uniref:YdgA family protein n=1 Tax=Deinococcus hohokamensis TaxID=309883 RepID=A0ABV9I4P5_9DEIO
MNAEPTPDPSSLSTPRPGGAGQTPLKPRATPGRRRPALVAGAGALGLAALLGGGLALTSSRTRTTTEDFTRSLSRTLTASRVARVDRTSYVRGLTGSTQTLHVAFGEAGQPPLRVLVINHIQHGPFPGFQAVGQALVDTEVRFEDPKFQTEVDRAFGGRKPQIRTLVGLDGGTQTSVDIPAGRLRQAGGEMDWQPLHGSVAVRGLSSSADLNWRGLTFTSPEGTSELRGVRMQGETRRSSEDDQLGVGQSVLSVEKMSFSSAGQSVELAGLKVSGESKLSGPDHYDTQFTSSVGSLGMAGQHLSDLRLELGLRHLARAPLNRLLTLVNEVQTGARAAGTPSGALPDLTPAQQQQLQADVLALIGDGPELSLDRLSLKQPSGDVVLRARATLPGASTLSREQLQLMLAAPAAAMGLLNAEASFEGPRTAVQELLSLAGPGTPGLASRLDDLVEAGMLRQTGQQLSARLHFGEGDFTLNGRSLTEF